MIQTIERIAERLKKQYDHIITKKDKEDESKPLQKKGDENCTQE